MGTPDRTAVAEQVERMEEKQQNCHDIAMETTYMHTTTSKAFLRVSDTGRQSYWSYCPEICEQEGRETKDCDRMLG